MHTRQKDGDSACPVVEPAIIFKRGLGPTRCHAKLRALTEDWIAAAGPDVLEHKPAAPEHPFFKLKSAVVTPHIAGQRDEDQELCWRMSLDAALALSQRRGPRRNLTEG